MLISLYIHLTLLYVDFYSFCYTTLHCSYVYVSFSCSCWCFWELLYRKYCIPYFILCNFLSTFFANLVFCFTFLFFYYFCVFPNWYYFISILFFFCCSTFISEIKFMFSDQSLSFFVCSFCLFVVLVMYVRCFFIEVEIIHKLMLKQQQQLNNIWFYVSQLISKCQMNAFLFYFCCTFSISSLFHFLFVI